MMANQHLAKIILASSILSVFMTICLSQAAFAVSSTPLPNIVLPDNSTSIEFGSIPSQTPQVSNQTNVASTAKNSSEIFLPEDELGELSRLSHPQITPFNTPSSFLAPVFVSPNPTILETQLNRSITPEDLPSPSPTPTMQASSFAASQTEEILADLPQQAMSPAKSGVGFLTESLIGVGVFIVASIIATALYITRKTCGTKELKVKK